MNIIYVTPEYVTKNKPATGLPNYLLRVATALVEYGHHPIIVTAGTADRHEMRNGVEVFTKFVDSPNIKNDCLKYTVNAILMGIKLNNLVHKICKDREIHMIQYTSLNGLGIFYHERCPAVLRLSSYAKIAYIPGKAYSEKAIKAMAYLERLSSRRMRKIFAPSQIAAKNFGMDVKRKVSVIETPYVNDVLNLDDSFYEERLGGKKYVLYFGVLVAEKGIFVINEVLNKFLETNPEYYFVFVGENRAYKGEDWLERIYKAANQYRDRVLCFPPQKHERLFPIIKNADFIVLPSIMENLSNACIEAMSFGKIVIGTVNTSFEQLIQDGINGFLSIPGDSTSLLDKMSKAVGLSATQRHEMETKARERVELLSPEYVVRRLIRFYRSCL